MTRSKALIYGGGIVAVLIVVLALTDNLTPEILNSILGAFTETAKEPTP